MAKKVLKTRYEKIEALLKRKLIRTARFANEMIEQHQLRRRRRVDGMHLPEHAHDVETPEDCWERAGKRIRQLDPDRTDVRAMLSDALAGK
jgi:hypothetical protein